MSALNLWKCASWKTRLDLLNFISVEIYQTTFGLNVVIWCSTHRWWITENFSAIKINRTRPVTASKIKMSCFCQLSNYNKHKDFWVKSTSFSKEANQLITFHFGLTSAAIYDLISATRIILRIKGIKRFKFEWCFALFRWISRKN